MSVIENIADGKYENRIPFRISPPEINEDTTTIRRAKEIREQHKEAERVHRQTYQEETARLVGLFRADLEAEHGLTGHPKAGRLWEIAWERGHSSGMRRSPMFMTISLTF